MKCGRCNGTGNPNQNVRDAVMAGDCPDCQGSGESEPCPRCGGIVPADIEAKKYKRGLRMCRIYDFRGPYYHVCNECLGEYEAVCGRHEDERRAFFKDVEPSL